MDYINHELSLSLLFPTVHHRILGLHHTKIGTIGKWAEVYPLPRRLGTNGLLNVFLSESWIRVLSQNILLDKMNNKLFNEHKAATIFQLNEKWGFELFDSTNTNNGNSLEPCGFTVAEFRRLSFRWRPEVYCRCANEIISSLGTSAWMIFDAAWVTQSLMISSMAIQIDLGLEWYIKQKY